LHGMPAKAFCLRLRATSFGSHTASITVTKELERHGSDGGDATVAASAGPGAIAAAAAKLLGELPALAALAPDIARPSGGRVLVVEDNEVNRSLLSVGLSRRGFTAFVAGSGEEAVRLAARDGFDAILMDIQMPGIDGFEAMRRIRDLGGRAATVPVVALTALSGSVIRKRCLDAGATAMIEKPVHIERLCRSLREWIAEAARSACEVPSPLSAAMIGDAGAGAADRDMLVSQAFLACVVDDVGLERTKACVEEFLQDVATQCLRLAELLPGWEADLLRRTCRDVRSLADTLGAIGLSEALEDLLDAVDRGSHEDAEGTMQRIKAMVSPLTVAMWSSLAEIERRRSNRRSEAA
jgi:CheY-like chemotaxis protein